jgi:hypothetical protein
VEPPPVDVAPAAPPPWLAWFAPVLIAPKEGLIDVAFGADAEAFGAQ